MREGSRTFIYDHPPHIAAHASIVGPKEGKGPLAAYFDEASQDDLFGQKTWEQGESEMLRRCATRAMADAGILPERCRRSSAATSTTRSSPRALPPAHWACPWWGFTGPVRRSWKGWYWPRRLSAVAICRTRSARHPATSARQNASSASPWRWARSARPRRSGRPRRRAACCSRRGSGQACASRPAHWGAS